MTHESDESTWETPRIQQRTLNSHINQSGTEMALCILSAFLSLSVYLCVLSVEDPLVLLAALPVTICTVCQICKILSGSNEDNSLICHYFEKEDEPIGEDEPRRTDVQV